jgi:hypothetical protein
MMENPAKGPADPAEREASGRRTRVSDGIRQGLGVLSALKDALDEAITEARDRGDLSPDRAREAVRYRPDAPKNRAQSGRRRMRERRPPVEPASATA